MAILEQLLVRWQLIQAETIETIMVTVFTKSRLDAKIWVLNWLEPVKKTYYSLAENTDVVG